MADSVVDRTALYAGETVLRMTSVISARQAVTERATVNNESMAGVLYFDGACGVCTLARDFLVNTTGLAMSRPSHCKARV